MIQVLLVEDDPMVAELNRLYVDRVGGFKTVASVRDGEAALAILGSQKIDLLLLDISMPGPNGMELLAVIRSSDLDVDVIFVTADRDTRTIGRALKLGAMDYLLKPFEFERMKQALEHYRETHHMMREAHPASQAELDRVFTRPPILASPGGEPLPKGLDRTRLDSVWKAVQRRAQESEDFTCEELSVLVGITRVSIRKYLEFLCGLQVLRMEPGFGAIGRPVHRYRIQSSHLGVLRRFL